MLHHFVEIWWTHFVKGRGCASPFCRDLVGPFRGTTPAFYKMGPPNLYKMVRHNPCTTKNSPYKMVLVQIPQKTAGPTKWYGPTPFFRPLKSIKCWVYRGLEPTHSVGEMGRGIFEVYTLGCSPSLFPCKNLLQKQKPPGGHCLCSNLKVIRTKGNSWHNTQAPAAITYSSPETSSATSSTSSSSSSSS